MAISTQRDSRWAALALIVTAQFMVILDVAIVNVALPSIKSDLDFSPTNLQWVISAYAILFGGALLLGGRLADLLGRRRLFVTGLALFSAASLLCGVAWSEASLIGFRAVQGLGGALLVPAALSLLMTIFAEGRERNLALGIYAAASGSGAAAGVLLGGLLTSYLSWSWIFFINVPVGLAAIALTPLLLRESRADLPHRHFDLPGAASVTAGSTGNTASVASRIRQNRCAYSGSYAVCSKSCSKAMGLGSSCGLVLIDTSMPSEPKRRPIIDFDTDIRMCGVSGAMPFA